VTRHSSSVFLALLFGFILVAPRPAHAQTPADPANAQPPAATTTATQAAPDADDDAKLRPLEPDFTVINLPTTLPLPFHAAGNFRLTHRFVGVNFAQQGFSEIAENLFGFDGPAVIQLEYRIAVMKHLEAIVARTNFDRTIQFSAKYDAIHQDSPRLFGLGLSLLASVEGGNNFRSHDANGLDIGYSPALGASVSRTLGKFAAVYVDPIWVHNTARDGNLDRQDTFYVGLGGRFRIVAGTFVVAEVSPRATGYGPGNAEFAFSLEKRVGGHMFSLVFANTQATTFGQIARGGNPDTLYIGFNLARKFY
jgi:uncharacterized beta barrel domain-containing protein DUF5777